MNKKLNIIPFTVIFEKLSEAYEHGYVVASEQGSSRSSKTYNTVIWLVYYCLMNPNTTVSVCRATLPAIKGSVLRDFIEIVQNIGIYQQKNFNKSELIYYFDNGSFVEFFSCDNEQKLRGRKRDILYVNEANELKYIEWQQLQLRTTKFSIIDYNPSFSEDHWICEVNKDPRTCHFITTYKDNPFLEQKVIDEIESLQYKNKSLWQVYGLGLQAQVEGLVFENVEVVKVIPEWCKKKIYLGMDLGYTFDPTAIVEVCITDDTIYVDELCYRTRMLVGDIVGELRSAVKERGEIKIISESADPRMIDEIQYSGFNITPVHKYAGSIKDGIKKMQEYKICITERSVNVIKEFRNYTYQQNKDGVWLNEPIDTMNHAIDAVRYVILEKVLGKNLKQMSEDELFINFL